MRQPKQRITAQGLDLKDQVISINRVTKVVKGGKNLSFAALVVVGDESGHVGFGTGKAREVPLAIKKGIEAAKKNLIRVPLIKNTLPHQLIGRYGAGRVMMKLARLPGVMLPSSSWRSMAAAAFRVAALMASSGSMRSCMHASESTRFMLPLGVLPGL